MRAHLIETFRPGQNDNYTYAELLALRAAGKDIPDQWIIRARQNEAADAEARDLSDAIAADLAAAEQAREKDLAEKDSRVLPPLRETAEELTELRAAAEEKRVAALEAIKEYRAAYRAGAAKFGTMRRTVREEYGGPVKDNDGNALPGQTFAHSGGDVMLQGDRVKPMPLAAEFDTPYFRGL